MKGPWAILNRVLVTGVIATVIGQGVRGTESEREIGAVDPTSEVSITRLMFPSEGALVEAILYRRRAQAGRGPALVVSTGAGRNLERMEWLSLPLAQRGYVVLAQRYRDHGTRFHLRDEVDIGNAISYLEGLPDVDAGRVGIAGHSRGGSAVLRAAAKDARVRSTAALAGPTDYDRWIRGIQHYSPSTYSSSINRYGATPDEDPEYFRMISPVTYAAQIKTPVLIVQGASDLRTPPDHAQWMYDALVAAEHPRVKLEMLPGMGHAFEIGGGYGFDTVVTVVGNWFAETV